jgi:hypothetical protein
MGNQTFCSCVSYQKTNERSNIIMENLIMELDQGTNKDIASSNRQLFIKKNTNKTKSEQSINLIKNSNKIDIEQNINNKTSINSNEKNNKINKNNNQKDNSNKINFESNINKINSKKKNIECNNNKYQIIQSKINFEYNDIDQVSSLKKNKLNIENKNCNNKYLKQNNELNLPKIKKIKSQNEQIGEIKIQKEIGLLKKEELEKTNSCHESCLPFVKIHKKINKN